MKIGRPQLLYRYLLYLAVATGLTWSLVTRIGSHLPLGTEGPATVPLFNLWTLLWNTEQLQQDYTIYWDAPIFYPEPGTFALSEPQPLTGLIFSLFTWISKNPVAAYNLVLLLFLILNAFSADWLLQKLGVNKIPAFLGGLLAMALPFVTNELGVLQLTAVFPIFFALAALWSFSHRPSWQSALAIGGWSAAAFLISTYYALFLTLFLLLGGLMLQKRAHLRPKPALQLLSSLLLAALILMPVLPQQIRLTASSRPTTLALPNSAARSGWPFSSKSSWLRWPVSDYMPSGSTAVSAGSWLLVLLC